MIRETHPADRPALERLQQLLPESAPALFSEAAGGEVLVSTVPFPDSGADIPAGYLLWVPGEPVYVAETVVEPAHRREGRGRRLFEALFDRLSEGSEVELRVAADNEVAQQLYRDLGFECVETIPDAYESGVGYRMRSVVEE